MNNVQIAFYIVLYILFMDILFLIFAANSTFSCWSTQRGVIGFFLYGFLALLLYNYDRCT